MANHPLTVTLRLPPIPLPGGEEPKRGEVADFCQWRFLSPGQGERWTGEAGTVRERFTAQTGNLTAAIGARP